MISREDIKEGLKFRMPNNKIKRKHQVASFRGATDMCEFIQYLTTLKTPRGDKNYVTLQVPLFEVCGGPKPISSADKKDPHCSWGGEYIKVRSVALGKKPLYISLNDVMQRGLVDNKTLKDVLRNEREGKSARLIPKKCVAFRDITNGMYDTFKAKNHDYGNSFSELFAECGMTYLCAKADNSAFVDNQQLAKMFALTEVEQPMPAGGVKKIPMYVMNRDGFTLLAMGFTGAKALSFKLEYINAFNAMEQQIRQSSGVPQSFAQALLLAAKKQEQIEAQQKQLEMQKPKVEFFEAVAESKTAIDIKAAANTLHFKNIGRNKLFEILRNAKILMWNNLPYQKYVDCGYFRTIEQKYTTHDGVKISIKTLVYQKEMDFIRRTLNNLGYKQVEQNG